MLWKGSAHQLWTKTFILALRRWQVAPLFLCALIRRICGQSAISFFGLIGSTSLQCVSVLSLCARASAVTVALSLEAVSQGSSAGGTSGSGRCSGQPHNGKAEARHRSHSLVPR
jgi:hypothetical protein